MYNHGIVDSAVGTISLLDLDEIDKIIDTKEVEEIKGYNL